MIADHLAIPHMCDFFQANAYKLQIHADQARTISVEKEVLDRAKSTESRLRTRCSRLATTINELKSSSHKTSCELLEMHRNHEELNAIITGYKARAAVMEQEEECRLAEIARLQGLLRESSISLAQCNVELAERDR